MGSKGGRPSQRDILVTLFPKDGSQYEMVFLKIYLKYHMKKS